MTFALKAFSEITFAGLGDIEVALTGVNGTASAGDEVINISVSVSASGISALTGTLGSESVTAGALVAASTNVGTTSLGNETVTGSSSVAAATNVGTTSLGNESVTTGSNVSVSGLAGASALGDETAIPSIEVAVTGASATGSIGTITSAGELDDEFGVSATGSIGNVIVWTETLPSQATVVQTFNARGEVTASLARTAQAAANPGLYLTDLIQADPNYTTLTTGVSQSYTEVTPSSSPTWTEEAA